jgi:hypothetical protein
MIWIVKLSDPLMSALRAGIIMILFRLMFTYLTGAEKRLNSPSPGVVPHRGRGDKAGTPFMLPLINAKVTVLFIGTSLNSQVE